MVHDDKNRFVSTRRRHNAFLNSALASELLDGLFSNPNPKLELREISRTDKNLKV
jgi:hypothetical protein